LRSNQPVARHRNRSRRSRNRRLKVALIVSLVVLLGGVTWLATRLLVVKTDLEASQTLVDKLQSDAAAFDLDAVSHTSAELEDHSASAAAGTRDLTWRIAEFVPFIGENLKGVRAVAESIDDVVVNVAVPAVDLIGALAPNPENTEGLDLLTPITKAESVVESAEGALARSGERLARIETGNVVGPVADAVGKLSGVVDKATKTVTDVGPMVSAAGAVLGQDAPRNYLMAFQNNAEATALGGSAASYTLINVDKGRVSIAAQAGGSNDLKDGTAVDVQVDQSALDLYTDYLVRYPNTSTSRPDFPTAASIMQSFWARDKGTVVDGVISIDPLALAQILKATGPITLNSGDVLSSDNAVSLLVNEIYFRYGSYEDYLIVDAFFQEAASSILARITTGDFDMKTMVSSITAGIDQGSILAWSTDPGEQSLLDGTRIQGVLPKDNGDATVIGTFYRDVSASKIDFYLETATETVSDVCEAPANPTFTTSVTLRSNLTREQANALPDYVSSQNFGTKFFATQVFVYGPVGATLSDSDVVAEGELTTIDTGATDLGRPVAKFTAYLRPGETSVVTATFRGEPGEYGQLEARGTPMINATNQTLVPANCG
jgi:hypothetical protein